MEINYETLPLAALYLEDLGLSSEEELHVLFSLPPIQTIHRISAFYDFRYSPSTNQFYFQRTYICGSNHRFPYFSQPLTKRQVLGYSWKYRNLIKYTHLARVMGLDTRSMWVRYWSDPELEDYVKRRIFNLLSKSYLVVGAFGGIAFGFFGTTGAVIFILLNLIFLARVLL